MEEITECSRVSIRILPVNRSMERLLWLHGSRRCIFTCCISDINPTLRVLSISSRQICSKFKYSLEELWEHDIRDTFGQAVTTHIPHVYVKYHTCLWLIMCFSCLETLLVLYVYVGVDAREYCPKKSIRRKLVSRTNDFISLCVCVCVILFSLCVNVCDVGRTNYPVLPLTHSR